MHAAAPAPPRASLGSTTPTALSFPNLPGELREPAASPLPLSPPPAPTRSIAGGSLTRDIQPVALHVLHRRGLAGWVLVSTHLGAPAPQDERARSAGQCSGRRWRHHAHPYPSGNNGRSRSPPHSRGERDVDLRAPPPLRGGNLHLEGVTGNLAFPTAAAQWACPALPAPAAHSTTAAAAGAPRHRGAWGQARPSSIPWGGGENHLLASRGGAKYLKAESRRGKSSASPGGRNHLVAGREVWGGAGVGPDVCPHSRGGGE